MANFPLFLFLALAHAPCTADVLLMHAVQPLAPEPARGPSRYNATLVPLLVPLDIHLQQQLVCNLFLV